MNQQKPEKEPIAYIYRESFFQSICADTYSFVCLFAVMAANHYLLADNWFSNFVLIVITLMYTIYSKDDVRKLFKI